MPMATVERVLRRDRLIIGAGLGAVALLAWAHLLTGAGTGMSGLGMTTWRFPPSVRELARPAEWTADYALFMLLMWWVMMIAMMLPAASPVILLHASVTRRAQGHGQMAAAPVPTLAFVGGYVTVWLGASAAATLLQAILEHARLLDGMVMWSQDPWLTAGLLLTAGSYQLSSLKRLCLAHCRAPVAWLSRHWRPGRGGAFVMGLGHGGYCLGCCWALMLLLFAGGVMNLLWIAGLSMLVLIEKLAPFGARLAPWRGGLLVAAAIYVVI